MPKKIAWAGIDPGLSGCACLLTETKIWFHDYEGENKASDTIDQWHNDFNVKFCLEMVNMINSISKTKADGKKSKPFYGSNSKLITNYGFWRGVLTAHRCNWFSKTPLQWQKVLPPKQKGEDSKDRALFYAKKFYPVVAEHLAFKKNHNRADALLIAHFVRKTDYGQKI